MASRDEPGSELWGLVRTIYRTALKRLNARLAKEKVTFSQYSVLLALSRNGPMPMSKLGDHMLVAPANVTGLVDRMEKKGLVRRRRDARDRRLYVIEPTDLGESTFRSISIRFRAYVRTIGEELTPAEQAAALSALKKMMAKVESTREI
jgi:MarR family transcriptional regulator, 2-MHQ and catechol-resistance regulon repressor